jgi:flagella basal body P-ring formation protein FlgA
MKSFIALIAAPIAAVAFASPTPETQLLRAEDIRLDVERALVQRLRDAGSGARIVEVYGLRDQTLPVGEIAIEVGAVAGRWPRSRASVPVRLRVNDRSARVLSAWVQTTDPRRVMTYFHAATSKARVETLRLALGDVDMVCCEGAVVEDADDLRGLRLRRAVRVGQPALISDFEPVPEVVEGDAVTIEVVRGSVRVTTVGTALTDGIIGQTIVVRPNGSNRAVAARVTEKQKVMIDERAP